MPGWGGGGGRDGGPARRGGGGRVAATEAAGRERGRGGAEAAGAISLSADNWRPLKMKLRFEVAARDRIAL